MEKLFDGLKKRRFEKLPERRRVLLSQCVRAILVRRHFEKFQGCCDM